jgi:hypothetical protein
MKILRKETEIEVEDANGDFQTYKLRFSLGAMRKFEELHGKSILEMFAPSIDETGKMMTMPDGSPLVSFEFETMVDLIWCGMIARHPELTREDVEDMFSVSDMEVVLKPLTNAVSGANERAFPEELVADGKSKKPPKK